MQNEGTKEREMTVGDSQESEMGTHDPSTRGTMGI